MIRRLVFALLGIAGLSLALRIAPYQVDDAYIAYRYAANLATGHGFVFNAGGPAVEGFTSPLWMLVLAGLARAASPEILPSAGMVLGLLSFLALLALLARAAGRAAPLAVALCALHASSIFYSVSGLETVLFMAIVVAWSVAAVGAGSVPLAIVAAVAAPWVRPEAAWLPVGLAAQLLATTVTLRGLLRPPLRGMLLALALSCVVLVAVRLTIFGELLPNTYYAKPARLVEGARYLGAWLAHPHLALLLAVALVGAVLGTARERGYLAAALAWMGAVVVEGGDWMPQARLLMPSMGLLALAACGVSEPLAQASSRWRKIVAGGVLALAGACVVLGALEAWREGDRSTRSLQGLRHEDRAVAEVLRNSGASGVAMVDIGVTGFALRELPIVDLGGLTDGRIAHASGPHMGKRLDLGYVFDERHPDVIVTRVTRLPDRDPLGRMVSFPEDAGSLIELALVRDPRMAKHYTPWLLVLPEIQRAPLYGRLLWRRLDFEPRVRFPRDVLLVSAQGD
jgi:hypothetical protein